MKLQKINLKVFRFKSLKENLTSSLSKRKHLLSSFSMRLLLILLLIINVIISLAIVAKFYFFINKGVEISVLSYYYSLVHGFDQWLSLPNIEGIASFALLLFSWIWFILLTRYRRVNQEQSKEQTFSSKQELAFIFTIICVAIAVFSFRYLYDPRPQGADTPDYIYSSNLIAHQLLLDKLAAGGKVLTVFFYFVIRQIAENIFSFSYLQSIMVLPIVLGIIYCLSIYRFVIVGTKNKIFGVMASLLASLTFLTIRMAWDLYGQLFGLSLMILFFSCHLEAIRTNRTQMILLSGFALLLTSLAHVWTAIVSVGILMGFIILSEHLSRTIKVTLKAMFPFFLLSLVALAVTPILNELLVPYMRGELNFFSLPSGWYWILSRDTLPILICSIAGGFYLEKRGDEFSRLILAWTYVLFLAMIVFGYKGMGTARVLMSLPVPILAAAGIFWVHDALRRRLNVHLIFRLRRMTISFRSLFILCTLLLLFQFLFFAILSRSFISAWVYTPNTKAIEQFDWIAQNYGYANKSIIILAPHDPQKEDVLRWGRAITGMELYVGHLLEFMQGEPDLYERGMGLKKTRYDIFSYSLIILPSAVYPITNLEKALGYMILNKDILIIRRLLEIDEIMLKGYAVWFDGTPLKDWDHLISTLELQHAVTFNNETLITIVHSQKKEACFSYQKSFLEAISAKVGIIRVKGNLTTLNMFVEVSYNDGTLDGAEYSMLLDPTRYSYICVILDPSKLIEKIRLITAGSDRSASGSYWMQLDYIAFL